MNNVIDQYISDISYNLYKEHFFAICQNDLEKQTKFS